MNVSAPLGGLVRVRNDSASHARRTVSAESQALLWAMRDLRSAFCFSLIPPPGWCPGRRVSPFHECSAWPLALGLVHT